MNDTVLHVAATLYGEAGMTLAMLYAAAYVMACRAELAGPGVGWDDLLGSYMGGWAWYKRAVRTGEISEWLEMTEIDDWGMLGNGNDALLLAYLLESGVFGPWQIAPLAEYNTGLQLAGPLLYCMSAQDVEAHGWPVGDVVVEGPAGYALHLYQEWPGR